MGKAGGGASAEKKDEFTPSQSSYSGHSVGFFYGFFFLKKKEIVCFA